MNYVQPTVLYTYIVCRTISAHTHVQNKPMSNDLSVNSNRYERRIKLLRTAHAPYINDMVYMTKEYLKYNQCVLSREGRR